MSTCSHGRSNSDENKKEGGDELNDEGLNAVGLRGLLVAP